MIIYSRGIFNLDVICYQDFFFFRNCLKRECVAVILTFQNHITNKFIIIIIFLMPVTFQHADTSTSPGVAAIS